MKEIIRYTCTSRSALSVHFFIFSSPFLHNWNGKAKLLTTKFVKTFWQTKEDVIDTPKLDILALSYWHFFFLILLDRKATEKIDVETLSFIIIIILFFFLSALCETR